MRTLLELYRLLRPRPRDLVPALVADVAAPLLALVPPYLLAHAIDDAVVPSEAGDLDRYVIALAVTVALLALATLAQEYLAARLAQRALATSATARSSTCRRCRSPTTIACGRAPCSPA